VTALNKIDRLPDADGKLPRSPLELAYYQESLSAEFPEAVLISAEKRWNIDLLRERLVQVLDRELAGGRVTSAG
jgi:50S ribosomal subunit-associated GTPase HflX